MSENNDSDDGFRFGVALWVISLVAVGVIGFVVGRLSA